MGMVTTTVEWSLYRFKTEGGSCHVSKENPLLYDFSENSEPACKLAVDYAKAFGSRAPYHSCDRLKWLSHLCGLDDPAGLAMNSIKSCEGAGMPRLVCGALARE